MKRFKTGGNCPGTNERIGLEYIKQSKKINDPKYQHIELTFMSTFKHLEVLK
jgi:hypothetical protein